MLSAAINQHIQNSQPVETITTMEFAAIERLFDGVAIAHERPQEALGALYLFGYAAECSLKRALGELSGLLPAQSIWQGALQPLRRQIDLHNLEQLLESCFQARRTRGLAPLPPARETLWQTVISEVALASGVTLRYRSVPIPASWIGSVFLQTEWIVDNAPELWT